MNDIRQYRPIEAKRFNGKKIIYALKPKSFLKTLKITILLAIIVGMPLWAIYGQHKGMMLITGAVLVGIYVVYGVLFIPTDDSFDILTDPGCSRVPGNIFYKEDRHD